MQFRGKNILETEEVNFFVENRDSFLEFCSTLCKRKKMNICHDVLEDVLGKIYDCLYYETLDEQEIKEELKNLFGNNECFSNYILSRSFLYLIELYIKRKNRKNISSLMNGTRKILEILNGEGVRVLSPINTPSFIDSLIEEKSMFSLNEDIVSTFAKILKNEDKLEFLNLYEGVCIRNFGKIISVEDEIITCEVPLLQILSMIEEKCAYIVKNSFTCDHVKADIQEFDISKKTVKLRNFVRFSNMPASQRVYARVHPAENIFVTLGNEEQKIEGLLYDISKGGLALLSKEELSCQEGDTLSVSFKLSLPNGNEEKDISFDVKLIILLDYNGNYRYCLKSLANENDEFIAKYTEQRAEETLKELENKIDNIKK